MIELPVWFCLLVYLPPALALAAVALLLPWWTQRCVDVGLQRGYRLARQEAPAPVHDARTPPKAYVGKPDEQPKQRRWSVGAPRPRPRKDETATQGDKA